MDLVGQPRVVGDHSPEEVVGEKYRILGVLGTGGIATTYVAQGADGNRVALKQLFLWRRHDWKVFELFEREARVLAQLNHPGIARYIDFFQAETPQGPCFYLAQELVSGRTLKGWLESGYRPTEDFVRALADQLLGIVEYLHGFRPPVIHRDIKPANLIWRADGTLALVDFGSVRDTDREQNDGSTIVGTFGYMAPEQFRGHAVPATDLYGVGATCAYLLTGKNPADLPEKDGAPRLTPANVSPALRTWTERLLARDPEARFPSASAARSALVETKHAPSAARIALTARLKVAIAGVALVIAGVALRLALNLPVAHSSAAAQTPAPAATTDVSSGRMKWVRNFVGHWSALFDIAVDPAGARLVTASNDGTAKVWDLGTAKVIQSLAGQSGRVGSVVISRDGANVVVGSNAIRIFDLSTGALLRTLPGPPAEVTSISFSPDGTRFASTALDGTTRFWDFASGQERAHFNVQNRCFSTAWSPDGDRVAVGCGDGKIYLLDARTGQQAQVNIGHAGPINALAYSPDGKTLLSAGDDHTIRIWSGLGTSSIATLNGHTDEVWTIAISGDGKTLVSGGKDGTLRLWDVYAAKQIDVMPVDKILKVRFLPGDERFVVAQSNGVAAMFTLSEASWQPPKITSPVPHVPRPVPPGASEDLKLCLEAEQLIDDAPSGKHYIAESRRMLKDALEKNPKSAFAHALLARIDYREGSLGYDAYAPQSLKHAHAELDQAEALDDKFVVVHVVRAYAYVFEKDIPKAKDSIARAQSIDAKDPRVLLVRGFVAQAAKESNEAFEIARSIVETTRDAAYLATAYDTLIDVYKVRNDWNAAEETYRSLVNLEPDRATTKGNLASYLLWRGKYDEAIDWAKRALAQMDYGAARGTLAKALAGKAVALLDAKGSTDEVERLVTEAEHAYPASADALYAGGRLQQALGNPVRAKLAFTAALALDPSHAGSKAALSAE